MTWLALVDKTQRRFSNFGIGIDRHDHPVVPEEPGSQMPCGTILIEATMPHTDRPELLFGYENDDHPAHRFLGIRALPAGGVTCLVGFGGAVQHLALDMPVDRPQTPLWISFSWNAAKREARLALEVPGTPIFAARKMQLDMPIFASDLRSAITHLTQISKSAIFVAISDAWEPLGPTPGLALDMPINTPFGPKEAQSLQRGDLVYTADGEQVPVLAAVQRRLPARGSARPIRIRAAFFGLKRDCVVSATQSLYASGSHVEYAHGCEAVLIPAGHLANGRTATQEPAGPIVDYVQVLTPQHTALSVTTGAVESLFIGRLRRHKDKTAATLLNDLPRRDLPEQIATAAPVLDHSATLFLEQQRFG